MAKMTKPGVRSQPLIAVRDVPASTKWYSKLLKVDNLGGGEDSEDYNRLLCNGSIVLQLHSWNTEDHANLRDPEEARPGNGVLVWFEVDDFDAAVSRARALKAKIVREPHVNPNPAHRELWIEDPDGYFVVITSPDGEASRG